jgi:acyl-homoserine-lactone acylase
VEEEFGALDVEWGEVFRLRAAGHDLPANGGPGSLGIYRVVGYRRDGDRRAAAGGDSFVVVVEFARPPVARALIGYGNWSQPGSPHVGDQLELFAAKQLRPVWRRRAEVEEHLEEREVLPPPR